MGVDYQGRRALPPGGIRRDDRAVFTGRVALGRRNLFADARRVVASSVVVGLAVMLILLLDGLWAGVRAQASLYEDHTGAQLYVVAAGTRGLFTDSSSVPRREVTTVERTVGVRWAAPVRTRYSVLTLHDTKIAIGLVGSEPGRPGGAWKLAAGHRPRAGRDVVVDRVLAERHGLRVGSVLVLNGARLRVVGLSEGTASYMTGLVFVTHSATDLALRSPGTTTAILVGTDHPAAVRRRLEQQGLTVLDQATIRATALRLVTRIFGTPLTLMVTVGEIAGTLVIALIAYTAIIERRREYGIVKAIGATRRRLVGLAVGQTFTVAALGGGGGVLLFLVGRALVMWYRPQYFLVIDAPIVLRAAVALVVMSTVATVIPARRIAKLDPALAYRGG